MICLLERSLPLPLVLLSAVGSQPSCACCGSIKTKILWNETLERNGITEIFPSTISHIHLNGDTWRDQQEGAACCRCKDMCENSDPKMWQLQCPSFPSFPSLPLPSNISAPEPDPGQCWAPRKVRGFGAADGQNYKLSASGFSVTEDFYRYKSIDFCVWLLSFVWEPNQAWISVTFLMQATSPQMNSALKYSFWWHILIALQLFLKLLWVLCLCCLYIFHRLLEHSLNQMGLRYHGDVWHYYGWPLSFGLGQQWLAIEGSIGCFCVRVCGCFKVLVWDGG